MGKKLTRFISAVIIMIAIVLIGMVLFIMYGIPHSIASDIKSIHFDGIIANIEEQRPCFSTIAVNQRNEIIKFDVCYCVSNKDFFKYAAVGDSIKKEEGRLSLVVTKRSSIGKKKFEYPYCIQ